MTTTPLTTPPIIPPAGTLQYDATPTLAGEVIGNIDRVLVGEVEEIVPGLREDVDSKKLSKEEEIVKAVNGGVYGRATEVVVEVEEGRARVIVVGTVILKSQ